MTRVAVVSATREDYTALFWTLDALRRSDAMELQLVATGSHLERASGKTVTEIRKDGFDVPGAVTTSLPSGRGFAVSDGIGAAVRGFARTLDRLAPDFLLLYGARLEMLAAAVAATGMDVPVGHLGAGAPALGDDSAAVRHAVTKLAHVHFSSTKSDAARVKQMGEEPWRIGVVGSPSVEYITKFEPLTREELEQSLRITFDLPVHLVNFHLKSTEPGRARREAKEVFDALRELDGQVLLTHMHIEKGDVEMKGLLHNFVRMRPDTYYSDHLTPRTYASLMKHANTMIGNSTSGIVEAPSFGLAVVDVGDRQEGREFAKNVVRVKCERAAILKGVRRAMSGAFRRNLSAIKNPYDRGGASGFVTGAIAKLPDRDKLLRKLFVAGRS